MKFMADAHKNIKDLLTAEEQREVLETTHQVSPTQHLEGSVLTPYHPQAYQLALSSERTHYTTQRDQQEAYLRLLQLVLVGQLKSKMIASQRNAFYLHFHQRLTAAPPKLTNKSGVLLLTVDGWRKAIATGDLLSTPQGVGEAVLAPLGVRINGAVLPLSPTEMLAGRLAYEQAEVSDRVSWPWYLLCVNLAGRHHGLRSDCALSLVHLSFACLRCEPSRSCLLYKLRLRCHACECFL